MRRKVQEGKITAAEYEEWLHLQAEVAAKKDELEQKNRELQRVHGRTYEAVQARAEASGNIEAMADRAGREGLMFDAEVAAVDGHTEDVISGKEELSAPELRLLELEGLARSDGSQRSAAQIDAFIAAADEHTLSLIADAPDKYEHAWLRVRVIDLKAKLADLEPLKDTPEYAAYLRRAVGAAPPEVRDALRSEVALDEALTAALYAPFSDTLDNGDESRMPESAPVIERATRAADAASSPAIIPPGQRS